MNTVHLIDGSYAFKTHFQKQMVFLKKGKMIYMLIGIAC